MNLEDRQEIIEKLRDDSEYYGEFGNNFLSNSMIKSLLTDPLSYGKSVEDSKELLIGRYFHQRILDPEREEKIQISDEKSRNSKVYKAQAEDAGGMLILRKELETLEPVIQRVEKNLFFMDRLRGDRTESGYDIEEPMIGEIHGELFKGKADRINHQRGMIYDLKTTSDLSKFRSSFYRYGYDTQAYIYSELFGMEFAFLVVDKFTGGMGYFTVSEQTLLEAELKVKRALEVKDLYFGDGDGDLEQYVNIELL